MKMLRYPACLCALALVSALPLCAQKKKDAPVTEEKAEQRGAKPGGYYAAQPGVEDVDLNMYARIRTEGMTHGKVMQFAGGLIDGIGPRLTGSPNMAKANAFTRDTLAAIGLSNAHLEDWGEFGMGWQQINTWARMVSPDPEPLWLQAAPWSPATSGPVTGQIVYVPLNDEKELDALRGKLAGKIVLLGAMRTTPDITEPLFKRYTDAELKEMEGAPGDNDAQRRAFLGNQTIEQYIAARQKAR